MRKIENCRIDLPIRFVTADGSAMPYTQELRGFLSTYPWKDEVKDRDDRLKKLRKDLKKIKKREYDFSHLEEGNGVHEFRRDLRWFSIQAKSLNGLVVLKSKDSPCPIAVYADVVNDPIATSKHAILPVNPAVTNPVQLSPCLFVKVAKLIKELDTIKDQAEAVDSIAGAGSDAVDAQVQAELNFVLQELRLNELFDHLRDELKVGMSPEATADEAAAE